jgi:hypothetical protein
MEVFAIAPTFSSFNIIQLIPRAILLLCWITLILLYPILIKRTKEGASLYGATLGFIEYLEHIGSKSTDTQLFANYSSLIPYFVVFDIDCQYVKFSKREKKILQSDIPSLSNQHPLLSPRDYKRFYDQNYFSSVSTSRNSSSSDYSSGGGSSDGSS